MKIFKKYYELQKLDESYQALVPVNESWLGTAVKVGKALWKALKKAVEIFVKTIKVTMKVISFIAAHILGIMVVTKFVAGYFWGEYVDKGGEKLTGIAMWSESGERIRINYKGGISEQAIHSVDYWDSHNWDLTTPTRTVIMNSIMDVGELGPMLRNVVGDDFDMEKYHKGKMPKSVEQLFTVEKGKPCETSTSVTVKVANNLDKIYDGIEDPKTRTETVLTEMELINGRDDRLAVNKFMSNNKNADIKNVTMFATLLQNGIPPKEAETIAMSITA